MAFPTVVGTPQDSTSTSQVTSHTVNVNSPANGDLLLLVVHFKSVSQTITWPVGKTMTQVGRLPQSTNNETVVFYRFCDGAEGATITMTTSATTRMVARAWRFTGHHTSSAPEAAFFVYGAVNNPNPPSLTPTWGAADTQWLATFGNNNGTETVSAFPTNYISTGAATTGSSTGATLGYGLRQLNAASEDPGTFTKSATSNGVATTIAIRPTAGATTFPQTLSATATGTATDIRQAGKVGSAAASGAAALLRQAQKVESVAASGAATLLRQAQKTQGATATGTASLAAEVLGPPGNTPVAILYMLNLSGTVTDIQDSPEAPDANWLTAP